jgi:hypothetical protein
MLSRLTDRRLPRDVANPHGAPGNAGWRLVDHGDTDARRAFEELLQYLFTKRGGEWSLLLLDNVPGESPTRRYFRSLPGGGETAWESEILHESLLLP